MSDGSSSESEDGGFQSPSRPPSASSSGGDRPVSPGASSYRGDCDRYHPYPALLSNLNALQNDAETADITIAVGERRFPAHKALLIASSTYFRNMFIGPWKESKSTEVNLEDTDECKAVFDIFLSFFYGCILKFSLDNVMPILTLADKYDVKELKTLCEMYMVGFVAEADLEHAIEWFPFAERFNMTDLKHACCETICLNFEEASNLPAWSSITIDQLASLLNTENLIAVDEFMVYNIIQEKLLEDKASKTKISKHARQILPLVQFKMMAAHDLLKVEKSELAKILPPSVLKNHLSEAYRHIALESAGGIVKEEGGCSADNNTQEEEPKPRVYSRGLELAHFDEGSYETIVNIRCREYREIHHQEWTLGINSYRQLCLELYKHAHISRHLPMELLDSRFNLNVLCLMRDYRARVLSVEKAGVEDVYMPTRRGDNFAQIDSAECWCSVWRQRRNDRRAFRCSCQVTIHNFLYSITAHPVDDGS